MGEPVASAASAPIAEVDRRFQAFVLDRLVAWSLHGVGWLAAWWFFLREGSVLAGLGLVVLVLGLVTVGFAVPLGLRGTSPGRQALGLRVVDHATGEPIGFRRAVLRTLLLEAASAPTFGLGLVMLAWTVIEDREGSRRGWHDHLLGSLVVDVRPAPDEEVREDERPRQVVNLTAMRLQPVVRPSAPTVPPGRPGGPDRPAAGVAARSAPGPVAESTPEPPESVRTTVARRAPAPTRPRWRVTFDSGESLEVEGLGLLGRHPAGRQGEEVRHLVPLRSEDMSISKTHAQVDLVDGTLVVTDRGSTNGSVLVRQGVSRDLPAGRPTTLVDGDLVLFGDRQMRVERA